MILRFCTDPCEMGTYNRAENVPCDLSHIHPHRFNITSTPGTMTFFSFGSSYSSTFPQIHTHYYYYGYLLIK
jgi:hypothetical protein